jgi:predicted transcriptional regulator
MATTILELLPHGSVQLIAHKLGIGKQAVSKALKKQRPGHPAVVEALRMARASGAIEAAQELRTIMNEEPEN